MKIIELDPENTERYTGYIPEDVAENIGRTFYHGLIVKKEDTPAAGIVWKVINVLRKEENESHIEWLKIDSEEAAEGLFETYRKKKRTG